jgi:hypothetical protein
MRRPRGRRSPLGCSSTNGSRTQLWAFSLVISFDSAKQAAPSGRISAARSGSSASCWRPASSSAPSSAP